MTTLRSSDGSPATEASATPTSAHRIGAGPRWVVPLALVATVAAGTVALAHEPHDYVTRAGAPWFVLAGALVAISGLVAGRSRGLRAAALLVATAFLLPAGGALSILHGLRLVRAIPMPLDVVSAGVSAVAGAALVALWVAPSSLRPERGARLDVPRRVVAVGVVASLGYPVLKVSWALGSRWLAPVGAVGVVDATFVVTTALCLAAVPALPIALRWFDRPAPRWARPTALAGGLVLTALGASGVWATATGSDDPGGGIVYVGWLVWGLCTVAVSHRLSADTSGAPGVGRRPVGAGVDPADSAVRGRGPGEHPGGR